MSESEKEAFIRGIRKTLELVEEHLSYCQGWHEFDAAVEKVIKETKGDP